MQIKKQGSGMKGSFPLYSGSFSLWKISSSFSWYHQNTGVRKMPGKKSRGKEDKKQFFGYGLLHDIFYLFYLTAGYKTAAWNQVFLPFFSSDRTLKINGLFLLHNRFLNCGNNSGLLLYGIMFSSSVSCFFCVSPIFPLRILGFLLFLEKRGRGKGGWEADLLAWDFCGYFLFFFMNF